MEHHKHHHYFMLLAQKMKQIHIIPKEHKQPRVLPPKGKQIWKKKQLYVDTISEKLPIEIHMMIFSFLDRKSVSHLSITSKYFRSITPTWIFPQIVLYHPLFHDIIQCIVKKRNDCIIYCIAKSPLFKIPDFVTHVRLDFTDEITIPETFLPKSIVHLDTGRSTFHKYDGKICTTLRQIIHDRKYLKSITLSKDFRGCFDQLPPLDCLEVHMLTYRKFIKAKRQKDSYKPLHLGTFYSDYSLYKSLFKKYIKSIKVKTIIFGYDFDIAMLDEWIPDSCSHVICDHFDVTFFWSKPIKFTFMEHPSQDIIDLCWKSLREKSKIIKYSIDSQDVFYWICEMYPLIIEYSYKFYTSIG